jgi:tetratricopeptide (TPR) repeat protein
LALSRQADDAPAPSRVWAMAFDCLNQARTRSSEDAQIRRTLVQVLAAEAELLGRLGRLRESTNEWDRALRLAAGDDILALRLGRAMTLSRSGDYRTALADVAAAELATPQRASLLIRAAAVHAGVSEAINCDPALSEPARAVGVAAQRDAALDQIRRARATPAHGDARRLPSTLLAPEFAPLRGNPGFGLLIMDLAFPTKPFARAD